jgi:hypothetical protein
MNTETISATTFQLKHLPNTPFKNTYDVGDSIIHPLGQGIITDMNANGNCRIKLINPNNKLTTITECKNCGSKKLKWHCSPVNLGGVQDGRIRMHETEVIFYLGCEDCSETLKTLHGNVIAEFLNEIVLIQ